MTTAIDKDKYNDLLLDIATQSKSRREIAKCYNIAWSRLLNIIRKEDSKICEIRHSLHVEWQKNIQGKIDNVIDSAVTEAKSKVKGSSFQNLARGSKDLHSIARLEAGLSSENIEIESKSLTKEDIIKRILDADDDVVSDR